MEIITTKINAARNANKNALGMFTKAITALMNSNKNANLVIDENSKKRQELLKEETEMIELSQQNTIVIENIEKLIGVKSV